MTAIEVQARASSRVIFVSATMNDQEIINTSMHMEQMMVYCQFDEAPCYLRYIGRLLSGFVSKKVDSFSQATLTPTWTSRSACVTSSTVARPSATLSLDVLARFTVNLRNFIYLTFSKHTFEGLRVMMNVHLEEYLPVTAGVGARVMSEACSTF